MPDTRHASIACSVVAVAMLAACGSGDLEEHVATATSPVTTTVDSVPPDPAFEGANPCDLLTSDEVEAATGAAGLTGKWQPNEDAGAIGCNWGDGPGSVNAGMSVHIDPRFMTTGRTFDTVDGREVKISQAGEQFCMLTVDFSGERTLGISFIASPQQKKAEKNPSEEVWCGRTLDLVKAALPRLNWT